MTDSWMILHSHRWRPTLYRLITFNEQQGLATHFVFPSHIAKRRFQPGDFIAGTIDHRTFDVSLTFSPQVFVLGNHLKLAVLSCVTELLQLTLPENHPYPHLYRATEKLLQSLSDSQLQSLDHITAYSHFERLLLAETGFGLALDSCAVTGSVTNLAYISPKTGRAVSHETGAAYHEKLLLFPQVWQTPSQGEDWDQALKVSGFFIQKQLRQGQELPYMRNVILSSVRVG